MIRNLYRSVLAVLICYGRHQWREVRCLARVDWNGNPLPLVYEVCSRCGLRDDGGFDD